MPCSSSMQANVDADAHEWKQMPHKLRLKRVCAHHSVLFAAQVHKCTAHIMPERYPLYVVILKNGVQVFCTPFHWQVADVQRRANSWPVFPAQGQLQSACLQLSQPLAVQSCSGQAKNICRASQVGWQQDLRTLRVPQITHSAFDR